MSAFPLRSHQPPSFRGPRGRLSPLLLLCLVHLGPSLAGCGSPSFPAGSEVVAGVEAQTSDSPPQSSPIVPAGDTEKGSSQTAALPRKIIYTAEVELVAQRLTEAEQRLTTLVRQHGGYVAQTEVAGSPGEPRTGHWKVRIPVDRFEAFMEGVTRIGELRRTHTDSQDVSEEYYDLGARLHNKQVEERRLVQHLERSTAGLSDILAVEKELSRVREEIERIQGRLRFLTNQTDFTTVSVTLNEVSRFLPQERTHFGTQLVRTFLQSLGTLGAAIRVAILGVVWIAPWPIALGAVIVPVTLLYRRRVGRRDDL